MADPLGPKFAGRFTALVFGGGGAKGERRSGRGRGKARERKEEGDKKVHAKSCKWAQLRRRLANHNSCREGEEGKGREHMCPPQSPPWTATCVLRKRVAYCRIESARGRARAARLAQNSYKNRNHILFTIIRIIRIISA